MPDDLPDRLSPDIGAIALLEETAQVKTEEVTTGRVRVATHVETFEDVVRAELTSDTVEVTRVPKGTPVVGPLPQLRVEGDLTVVPVFEEVLVVEKRLVLKEEIHIRRRMQSELVEKPISLRREMATVERVPLDKD